MGMIPEQVISRFEAKVMPITETGCWIWMGAQHPDGYGNIGVNGRTWRANRLSYVLYRGEIPGNMHVLHSCDTPECVNPNHLWLGTNLDNIKDRIKKGRSYKHGDMGWEKNFNCDLTPRLFSHPRYGKIICTRVYLTKVFRLDPSSVTKLVKGRVKTHKGRTHIRLEEWR